MELAKRSGTLLARACLRAEGRGDIAATVELLQRAINLLPPGAERRLLIAQVALEVLSAGDGARAESLLIEVLGESESAHDERAAAWAQLGLLVVRSSTQASEASEYVREAERLRDHLSALGDVEGAQQAQLLAGWGLFSSGRAAACFSRTQAVMDADPPPSAPIVARAQRQRGVAAVYGPLPADDALKLIEQSIAEGMPAPGAELGASRMLGLIGRIPEARAMIARGREKISELGDRILLSTADAAAGTTALLSGDVEEAIRTLQRSYDDKVATGDRGFASTTAAELAEAYLADNDLPHAWEYGAIARETSAGDDIASQAGGRQIQARVLAARGEHAEAEALAREAVAIMERTDYLVHHGDALVHLARVLHAAGKADEALAAARTAVELYDRKRATFLVERTRQLIAEWSGQPV
jgi:tetratricopeptide (TPR) repeat protein